MYSLIAIIFLTINRLLVKNPSCDSPTNHYCLTLGSKPNVLVGEYNCSMSIQMDSWSLNCLEF